ncbi:CcdC family protein [Bhargavaea ullalensis]|uniref:Membrane protein CcdC involved in cytochrome C biogenesis n=1 Tax=Bhargavaea ullalensis TaxID=1265685 RepID=A0ABV2G985_9BACL
MINDWLNWVFNEVPAPVLIIGSTVIFAFMGTMALIVRSKSAKRPASAKKILLPPIMMSTGALMFLFDPFKVPWTHVLEASVVGLLFSVILIKTSKFETLEGDIYLKPSKAFIFILVGLLIFRVIAKLILSSSIDVGELAGMFFLLAFAMIVPWRIAMYVQFQKLNRRLKTAALRSEG